MTVEEFHETMRTLHEQAGRLPGVAAARLRDEIAATLSGCGPLLDERLLQLHRQVRLIEIVHRLKQIECRTVARA